MKRFLDIANILNCITDMLLEFFFIWFDTDFGYF